MKQTIKAWNCLPSAIQCVEKYGSLKHRVKMNQSKLSHSKQASHFVYAEWLRATVTSYCRFYQL